MDDPKMMGKTEKGKLKTNEQALKRHISINYW